MKSTSCEPCAVIGELAFVTEALSLQSRNLTRAKVVLTTVLSKVLPEPAADRSTPINSNSAPRPAIPPSNVVGTAAPINADAVLRHCKTPLT